MTGPLTDLVTALTSQLNASATSDPTIDLNDAVLGASTATALAAAFALPDGTYLSVSGVAAGDIADPVDGVLTVSTGHVAVFGADHASVTLDFWAADGVVQVSVAVALPDDWRLTSGFPKLTRFPFDVLTISEARFVWTSVAQPQYAWPDENLTIALEPGQNLLCRLVLGGVSLVGELLGEVAGSGSVRAYGPFSPVKGQALPVGTLVAPIVAGQVFSVGVAPLTLSLSDPAVAVRIDPTDELTPVQETSLLVQGTFQNLLDVSVAIPVTGGAYQLFVAPLTAQDGSLTTLISALPGGAAALTYLPSELDDLFSSVGLDSFTLAVGGHPAKVTHTSLALSTTESWKVIPDALELTSVRLVVDTTRDPSGPEETSVWIDAEAAFLPELFTDPFDFTVELEKQDSSWEVASVNGSYRGAVGLGTLIAELTGDTISADSVPEALRAITFSDFGVTATHTADGQPATHTAPGQPATRPARPLFEYTLYGTVETSLSLLDTALTARFDLVATKSGSGHTVKLTGLVLIGEQTFAFEIMLGDDKPHLKGVWADTGGSLSLTGIAETFGWSDLPALPVDLDLALTGAGFQYDFTSDALVLTITSATHGQLVFSTAKENGTRVYVVDLAVPLDIALSDLPVAGPQIPPSVDIGIEKLEIAYASADVSQDSVTDLNTTLQALGGKAIGQTQLTSGLLLSAGLKLGGETRQIDLPLGKPAPAATSATNALASADAPASGSSTPETPAPATPSGTPAQDTGVWITIGRSFGPLHIDRIGLRYTGGVLFFEVDADVAFGPLALSLDGLGVGSPLTTFHPEFSLTGLGVSYDAPPIQILGAILRVPDDQLTAGVTFQFDGELVVQSGKYGFGAIGSYAQFTDGVPSLFVFVQLEAPLGGVPAFFVTGVMGGFGFNRTLALPGQDEVMDFPLLLLSTEPPGGTGSGPQGPDAVLKILEGQAGLNGATPKQWITPKAGDYWLAAGLEFTTFKVIKSKALLAVDFGSDLTIALLGLSTLRLPLDDEGSQKPFALVEMMIRVVVEPSQGMFAATAILTGNSYVLTPDCHLTGGFAFYVWWGANPNAGQFVATLGGYHPAFKAPAYYPQVPRLGFDWTVSDSVSITGGAYFALTPSCAMAGGSLAAVYHDGGLRAWFTAYADFLISWHPFFYTGDIGVSIGVSLRAHILFFTVTITLSLGASLEIWGPPTGGVVTVHVVVVSFSVHFGSDRSAIATEPLDWSGFAALLPATADICGITLTDGLYKTQPDTAGASGKKWIVRAKRFAFETLSVIPASALTYDGKSRHQTTSGTIAITPMDRNDVVSTHDLTIKNTDASTIVDVVGWSLTPLTQTLPASLWSAPPDPFTHVPAAPSAEVLPDQVVGFSVTAPTPAPGATQGPVPLKRLLEEYLSPAGEAPWSAADAPTQEYVPTADAQSIGLLAEVNTTTVRQRRAALFAALTSIGTDDGSTAFTGTDGDLSALATGAGHLFADPPLRQDAALTDA
ncbi:DUF6603 domain-containing protein [Streptomyces sp. NPDC057638]|uniref:DUF6603 domain-containing protein n=1 Tax=Streptomyces sp. NPDC057638 TaxID=3346190 RepID=UPI0036958083